MLQSSNLDSIIDAIEVQQATVTAIPRPSTLPLPQQRELEATSAHDVNNTKEANVSISQQMEISTTPTNSLASLQLAEGLLQIFEPSLLKARGQLKELIGKQNKIYIDLSAEKFKLDNAEMAKLHEMMYNVKIYREKLIKIKKQMQSIYQRTKVLKKRAMNIQTCKQKELQRKLQKQQHEESLIGKQQK